VDEPVPIWQLGHVNYTSSIPYFSLWNLQFYSYFLTFVLNSGIYTALEQLSPPSDQLKNVNPARPSHAVNNAKRRTSFDHHGTFSHS